MGNGRHFQSSWTLNNSRVGTVQWCSELSVQTEEQMQIGSLSRIWSTIGKAQLDISADAKPQSPSVVLLSGAGQSAHSRHAGPQITSRDLLICIFASTTACGPAWFLMLVARMTWALFPLSRSTDSHPAFTNPVQYMHNWSFLPSRSFRRVNERPAKHAS